MSDIVILGAGGFIGRHLALLHAAAGADVVAATRAPVAFDHPRIRNVVARYDDASHFRPLLADAAAVVHAASSTTPGSTAAKPQLEGNLRTTLALVEALQDAPACRLVFLSSAGTLYGECDQGAREHEPLRPRSYHGAGKAAAEHFLHAWATQYGGTAVLLRPTNVFGPGQLPRRGFGVIPAAFDCALRGTPFTIWGDGSARRDYLYIDDFAALCVAAATRPLPPGARAFNAASGNAVSLDALLDHVEVATGRALQRVYQPARAVDVHSVTVDATAAREAFDWSPSTPLPMALARSWQWFSAQA